MCPCFRNGLFVSRIFGDVSGCVRRYLRACFRISACPSAVVPERAARRMAAGGQAVCQSLFVEIVLECLEFVLAPHASPPPRAPEACAVADELHIGGRHGQQADAQAAVLHRAVQAYQEGVERQRRQRPGAYRRARQQHGRAQGEDARQQMDHLQRVGVFLIEVDARDARVVHLLEELAQVRPPLVPHPCPGEQPAAVAPAEDADAEVDVLAEAHPREAAQCLVDLAPHAHVEAAGIELVHLLPPAPDAARGEERRHGVVDGLLQGGERRVCPVRPAEGVARFAAQLPVHGFQVAGRHDDVRVEDEKVFAHGPFGGEVARLSGAGIGFREVVQVQAAGMAVRHLPAGQGRAVIHDDDFEVAQRLLREALQQFVHFVGAVVDGDEEGVFHKVVRSCGNKDTGLQAHWRSGKCFFCGE